MHGGTCVESLGSFSCTCPDGYTGDTCQQDVDECLNNPCLRGDCSNLVNKYKHIQSVGEYVSVLLTTRWHKKL